MCKSVLQQFDRTRLTESTAYILTYQAFTFTHVRIFRSNRVGDVEH